MAVLAVTPGSATAQPLASEGSVQVGQPRVAESSQFVHVTDTNRDSDVG